MGFRGSRCCSALYRLFCVGVHDVIAQGVHRRTGSSPATITRLAGCGLTRHAAAAQCVRSPAGTVAGSGPVSIAKCACCASAQAQLCAGVTMILYLLGAGMRPARCRYGEVTTLVSRSPKSSTRLASDECVFGIAEAVAEVAAAQIPSTRCPESPQLPPLREGQVSGAMSPRSM